MKLGGSVITQKERPLTPNNRAIVRLAEEIKRANVKPLLIVHGGGSFGHPLAKEYGIAGGYKNSRQIIGFSKTHEAMVALNSLIVDALLQENIPAVAVQPSAFILTKKGRIVNFDRNLILQMLNMQLFPVLYGDAILDITQGFSILSGDQLVTTLATNFKASQVIIGVDVNGLYTHDPKVNPNAKLIRKISLTELKSILGNIGKSETVDVTGGMYGKISELIPALEKGVKVKMINAKRVNRLYKALIDEEVMGTKIEP
ncbi:MAG: isopentenyl phosphate kinase [Candidatus Bathyarchaeota archaeon]